jgi:hypothetical protein
MHLEYLPRVNTSQQRGVAASGYPVGKRYNHLVPYHDALQVEYSVSSCIPSIEYWQKAVAGRTEEGFSRGAVDNSRYTRARVPDDHLRGYASLMSNPDIQYANPDRVPIGAMDLDPQKKDYQEGVPPVISAALIASAILVGVALYNQ